MSSFYKWIEKIGQEEMDSHPLEPLFAIIKQHLPRTSSVLCVGCGDGTELKFFENARGVDIRPQNNPLIDVGDMHNLPYGNEEFEMVFAKDVFEHAVAPIVALEEMTRVSSKYVVIVLPDESWTESGWHLIIPNMRQLMALAEKVGLKLKYVREIRWLKDKQYLLENFIYVFEK